MTDEHAVKGHLGIFPDMPVHYVNHCHFLGSTDGIVFEFRTMAPSIFAEDGSHQVPMVPQLYPPVFRGFMTVEAAKSFIQALQTIVENR